MNGQLIKNVRAIVTVVLCVLAVIGIALFVTVNLSTLFIHLPSRSQLNLSPVAIRADYRRLLLYLQQPWPAHLCLHNIPLSPQAASHFRDVRHLMLASELIGLGSLVSAVWLLRKQKRQGQLWRVLLPLKWLVYLFVMVVWIPIINFSTNFICFHQLVFNNYNWVFVPDRDPIIILMPEQFFWQLFIAFVVIILVLLGLLWIWMTFQLGFLKLRTDKANDSRYQCYDDNGQDND